MKNKLKKSIWVFKNGKRSSLKKMTNSQIKKAIADIEKLRETWNGENIPFFFTWGQWQTILFSELTSRFIKHEIINIYAKQNKV